MSVYSIGASGFPEWVSPDGAVRLIHGDALKVLPTLEAGSVLAIVTDPPYGVRRPSARRLADERFDEIAGNDVVDVRWAGFNVLADGGACYCFCTWDTMHAFGVGLKEGGLRVRSCIVWDKEIHGLADLQTCWAPRHELILFAANGRHELRSPRPVDIIRQARLQPDELIHPYQKPALLLQRLIVASTDKGNTVADWYMGSGTCGVACIRTGRKFIGIEIEPTAPDHPDYFGIAVQRCKAELERFPLFKEEQPSKQQRSLLP